VRLAERGGTEKHKIWVFGAQQISAMVCVLEITTEQKSTSFISSDPSQHSLVQQSRMHGIQNPPAAERQIAAMERPTSFLSHGTLQQLKNLRLSGITAMLHESFERLDNFQDLAQTHTTTNQPKYC
jgi:hypothetical protein